MAPRHLCMVHERPCMVPRRQLTAMVRQHNELYTYIFVKSSLSTLFFWHLAVSNNAFNLALVTLIKGIVYSLFILTLARNSYLRELTQLGFLVLQEVVPLIMAQ